MNFSPMPEETSRLLVQIRKWAGLVGDWLGELLADRYLPLVLVKNPIVYALERFYAVSDRTPALVGARRGLHRATLPAVQNRARPSSAGSPLTQWQPWTSSAGSPRSTRSWRSLAAARRGSGPSSPGPSQSRSS